MGANPVLGIFFHAIGGFAAGSFYIPLKKVRDWVWESYWLVNGIFAWIIMPWTVALIAVPDLITVLKEVPTNNLLWSYIFGVLWGIGVNIDEGVDKASLQAVVEQPNIFRVSVNGHSVEPRPNEYWLDYAFRIFDIGKYIITGANRITLRVSPFTIHAELESIYILGNFGLRSQAKGWKIIPSTQLSIGEWNKQGIPFYSDDVAYSKTYNLPSGDKKYFVKLGAWLGTVAEVQVNKEHAGIIAWHPYSLDISDKVGNGENEISVVVYGSLKNLLGPHHNGSK